MAKLRYQILAEKLNIKRYFYMEYTILNVFGFDLNATERIMHRPFLSFSSVFAMGVIMVGMAHYSYSHIPDVKLVTDALTNFVQGVVLVAKFIILVSKRREIVDLIHRIWKLTENANEDELKILSKRNRSTCLLNGVYSSLIIFTGILASAGLPIVGALFYIFKGKYAYFIMLKATYPIKPDNPLNYAIIYAWSTYGVFSMICIKAGMDTVFVWTAQNIVAQFLIVQRRLELLGIRTKELAGNKILIRKSIIECIQYHQDTIQLARDFDRAYHLLTFVEVFLGSLQTCLLVFQLGRNIEVSRAIFVLPFLTLELLRLAMFSYCGQHLEEQSMQVAVTAFKSIQWQLWSIQDCKLMTMVILRSQRPLKITAVFFYVNMNLFITILRTAASYITLLRSIGDV